MRKNGDVAICANIGKATYDQLTRLAVVQDRSIASLIRLALLDLLARHGGVQ